MIDRASIMAWNEQAPWTEPAMVEQDLIICKALVCIFSEDIDLVQIHPGPIKPIMFRLGEVLSWMPGKRD